MMMRAVLLAVLLALMRLAALGQDLRILNINDGEYPKITVRVRLSETSSDSVRILEKGVPVEYTMQDADMSSGPGDGRMYVFLVENSYSFFHNGVFPSVRAAMLGLHDNIHGADNANILMFGMPGRRVRYAGAAQSGDMPLLSLVADDMFVPQKDSTYFDNDLVIAMEEALEYCRRHKKPQQTVILTVIARPLNLSDTRDFAPDFKTRVEQSGVYLNILMYDTESQNIRRELEDLAQASGGGSAVFQKDNLEGVLAQRLERMATVKSRNTLREVIFTFEASQAGHSNSFTMEYGGTQAWCEYSNPSKNGFLGRYPIAVLVIIGLLVVLAAAVFYIRTRDKIIQRIDSSAQTHFKDLQRQNRQLRQEIEKYKRNPLSLAHSFDNIYIEETLIGSGKIVPKLVVDDRHTQHVFKLNKFTMTLGRGEGCDIVIDNRTVSSHHATLTNEGGLFYISDNDSTNGTFVNDIRITKSKIQPKDRIRIGAVMATLVY